MQEELTQENNDDIIVGDTEQVSSSNDIDVSVSEESEEKSEIEESVEKALDNDVVEESIEEESEEEATVEDKEEESAAVDESEENESIVNSHFSSDYVVYSSDTSIMDYTECIQEMIVQQQTTNELLFRINEQNDLIIGVGVTLIICCIAYAILEKFCRF